MSHRESCAPRHPAARSIGLVGSAAALARVSLVRFKSMTLDAERPPDSPGGFMAAGRPGSGVGGTELIEIAARSSSGSNRASRCAVEACGGLTFRRAKYAGRENRG